MTEMYRRTFAEVNLEHLSANYAEIRRVSANADRFLCPMVKANAYGHGDVQVALHLEREGATHLGVCLIEEGLLLRSSGLRADILVFRGFDKQGAQKIVDTQMTAVISSWSQIEALESVADEPMKVHVKFNTGMNRLGFNSDQVEKIYNHFQKSKKLKLKGILSHFYNGEDAFNPIGDSAQQAVQLEKIYDYFKPMNVHAHLLNSGGITSLAQINREDKSHYLNRLNWGFRPGLILYGYQPHPQFNEMHLQPVMTLKSVVNNIRSVKAGEIVSYGGRWKAERDSRIAVVPIGYADGVHRLLSNRTHALFAGQNVPLVGRICMDFLMLDVTDVVGEDQIQKFDEEEVVLFGHDQAGNFLSAEQSAKAAETISWEILTSVGERVPRHYKGTG